MKCNKESMLLYAVTDRTWLKKRTLAQVVEEALKGGVTMVQLREKELDFIEFLKEAYIIKDLCRKYQVPFIINDDLEVAIACDADGIHIGQHDLNIVEVRQQFGKEKIIGMSAQTVKQAKKAVEEGADYLGVGAVFPTTTKRDADFVPFETLKEICLSVNVPVCAIGGIYDYNIKNLMGSKIDGVALVSAIFAQENIKKACEVLFKLSKDMVNG